MNDITDLPPSKKWRVQVTRAQVLDLCVERCAPIYEKFDMQKEKLFATQTENFKQNLHSLVDSFWREVSGATQENKP